MTTHFLDPSKLCTFHPNTYFSVFVLRCHLSQENIWRKTKNFGDVFLGKKRIKRLKFRTSEFWTKYEIESLREQEKIVQVSNTFVRPTEIFQISRFEILRVFCQKKCDMFKGPNNFLKLSKSSRNWVFEFSGVNCI